MRTGYNATRRNRNIGTDKQGYSQDNEMVIPNSYHVSRIPQETIGKFQKVEKNLSGRILTFLIEENNGGCIHSCSVADVVEIFKNIPFSDWHGLELVVFRQPTRKQRTVNPVWGRLYYYSEIGKAVGKTLAAGPAIYLEAMQVNNKFSWPTSLDPQYAEELERLREDGHEIERIGRKHVISKNPTAVRNTQLYRTVIHEVGHWVDYLQRVYRPFEQDVGSLDDLEDAYFSRPKQEREAFAHRYADELGAKLRSFGIIPFNKIED